MGKGRAVETRKSGVDFDTLQQCETHEWIREEVLIQYELPINGVGIGMPGYQIDALRRCAELYGIFSCSELWLVEKYFTTKLENRYSKVDWNAETVRIQDCDINKFVRDIERFCPNGVDFFEYDNHQTFTKGKRAAILSLLSNITPSCVLFVGSVRHGKWQVEPIFAKMRKLGYDRHIWSMKGPVMAIVGILVEDGGSTFEYDRDDNTEEIVLVRSFGHNMRDRFGI